MSRVQEKKREENNHDFKWGTKIRDGPSPLYSSFIFNGMTYRLYDCVVFLHDQAIETDVGKIVKMWESPYHEKKMKVVWFFRPRDIKNFLGGYVADCDELFLAAGNGDFVSSILDVGKVLGKCNVVCLSDDRRNSQPSAEDSRVANYHFSHVFDVDSRKVSSTFPNTIDNIPVESFFNRDRLHERKETEGQRALLEKPTEGETGRVKLFGSSSGSKYIADKRPPVGTTNTSFKHSRASDENPQLTRSQSWHHSKRYRS